MMMNYYENGHLLSATSSAGWPKMLLDHFKNSLKIQQPATLRYPSGDNFTLPTSAPPRPEPVAGLRLICRWRGHQPLDVTFSGLVAPPQWSLGVLGNVVTTSYSPTLVEFALAVGIVAYALLGFTLRVRF